MHAYVGEETDADGRRRHLYDALQDKDATVHWFQGIAGEHSAPGLAFHREPTVDELPPGGPSIVVGAEQSNTSVIFGDTVILKVFRKVSPGLNPDIEIHSALAAAGSTHIAAPLGWLEGSWTDGDRCRASPRAWRWRRPSSRAPPRAGSSPSPACATSTPRPTCTPTRSAATSPARRTGWAWPPPRCTPPWPRRCRPDGSSGKELAGLAEGMRSRLDRTAAEVTELEPYVEALRVRVRRPRRAGRAGRGAAGARRLPPRPGDAHPRRLEAARLRGRAGPPAGRATRPRVAGEGRRRDAAVVRLRRPAPARRPPGRPAARVPRRRSGQSATATPSAPDTPRQGAPTRAARPCCCGRSRPTRRSTRSSTRPATGPPGCRSRWPRSAGSPPPMVE